MSKKRVAIVGATGYTGAELIRLLEFHPEMEVAFATSGRNAGQPLSESCPWLSSDITLCREDEIADVDGVFLCQENGVAAKVAPGYVERGYKVVDLSADYRLRSEEDYQRGYGKPHPAPKPEFSVAYGLPETGNREAIRSAQLVANPGCYVAASVLALYPLSNAGLITGTPVIDGKSGSSGAGRSRATTEYIFAEAANSVRAYVPIGHRHTPEIEQSLGVDVHFTPHMMPMPRGMHASCYVPVVPGTTADDLRSLVAESYADEPFVNLLSQLPETKAVLGSNRCDIWIDMNSRTNTAVVMSCLDNLVKGASGSALQNMNLLLGLDETLGLPKNGVWP